MVWRFCRIGSVPRYVKLPFLQTDTLTNQGITILFLAIDVALFFNSYVNPIALKAMNWKYYIVYDVWLAVELVYVFFTYVETRNTPLEEIVRLFDGDGALLGGDLATEKSRQLVAATEDGEMDKTDVHVVEAEKTD